MGSSNYPVVYSDTIDIDELIGHMRDRIKTLENVVEDLAMKDIYGY